MSSTRLLEADDLEDQLRAEGLLRDDDTTPAAPATTLGEAASYHSPDSDPTLHPDSYKKPNDIPRGVASETASNMSVTSVDPVVGPSASHFPDPQRSTPASPIITACVAVTASKRLVGTPPLDDAEIRSISSIIIDRTLPFDEDVHDSGAVINHESRAQAATLSSRKSDAGDSAAVSPSTTPPTIKYPWSLRAQCGIGMARDYLWFYFTALSTSPDTTVVQSSCFSILGDTLCNEPINTAWAAMGIADTWGQLITQILMGGAGIVGIIALILLVDYLAYQCSYQENPTFCNREGIIVLATLGLAASLPAIPIWNLIQMAGQRAGLMLGMSFVNAGYFSGAFTGIAEGLWQFSIIESIGSLVDPEKRASWNNKGNKAREAFLGLVGGGTWEWWANYVTVATNFAYRGALQLHVACSALSLFVAASTAAGTHLANGYNDSQSENVCNKLNDGLRTLWNNSLGFVLCCKFSENCQPQCLSSCVSTTFSPRSPRNVNVQRQTARADSPIITSMMPSMPITIGGSGRSSPLLASA